MIDDQKANRQRLIVIKQWCNISQKRKKEMHGRQPEN